MSSDWRDSVTLDDQQRLVRDSIREISEEYGDEYWRELDIEEEYPENFVDTLANHDWLGILIPEKYGGVDMGTKEVVVMMEELAANGGGFAAPQSIHGGVYNSVPIVRYASEELKEEILPGMASGDIALQSLGLTEPNAGSDSTSMETQAEKNGGGYIINGQKIWISRVDHSDYLLLMARTTPKDQVEKRTRGISMFLVDLHDAYEQDALKIQQIPKTAATGVHSFEMWFSDLHIPERNLVGTEGEGFYQLLDGLNEERLAIAAEALGLGFTALDSAVEYADEREIFGAPIGSNQAIQHPIAEAYARLRAAKQVTYSAAEALDKVNRTEAGARANTAKFLAADAAFEAADIAVQTHGGFGVAREYDVERYFREARLTRLVPITQQLVLNYLGNSVLGLPRSY